MEQCIDLRGRGLMCINSISIDEFKKYEYCILRHYTSSELLNSIQQYGLLPPSKSNVKQSSFDEMSSDEDRHYIYLTGNEDLFFAQNTVQIHGGKPAVLTVKAALKSLEADDYNNIYSSNGIDPRDMRIVHQKLTAELNRNCRTRYCIKPEDILDIIILD